MENQLPMPIVLTMLGMAVDEKAQGDEGASKFLDEWEYRMKEAEKQMLRERLEQLDGS